MNDPQYLRAGTILAAFADAGAQVAVVTAKDKLRALLGHRMRGVCFSSEKAAEATRRRQRHRRRRRAWSACRCPSVYSAELSEFVFAAGVQLMERERPDIMYLSTTDYIQHKAAPGRRRRERLLRDARPLPRARSTRMGATIVLTADHGMNAKTDAFGRPNVIYLQDVLDAAFGAGTTRVILPITDPYVVHHGALGSFATVYASTPARRAGVAARIAALPGIEAVLHARGRRARASSCRPTASATSSSSSERLTVIGTSRDRHDLSGLDVPLRSHGGISEQQVPLIAEPPRRRAAAAAALAQLRRVRPRPQPAA